MTTKDEALKLALEALEYIEHNYMSLPAPATKAITALQEALNAPLAEHPAQQQVAWSIETNNQVEALAKQCGWDNRRYMTPADYQIWCDRMRQFVQLASPPAQRKPLTDEQIMDIAMNKPFDSCIGFARAIEAAHGIKEKNT